MFYFQVVSFNNLDYKYKKVTCEFESIQVNLVYFYDMMSNDMPVIELTYIIILDH